MGNLKFLSLLFCVVVASVDFASCLKCYRCVSTEPYLPELESAATAEGYPYNKECGSDNPLGSNLVVNPGGTPFERTPTQLPNTTSSFMSKLVLSALAKVPSAKVILSQLNGQKSNTVVNGAQIPSQAQMVEHCVKFMVKLDTDKLMEGAGLVVPPGVTIPAEILTVYRDFYTDIQTVNQCFTMKELPAQTVAEIEAVGVLDIQLCLCNDKDGCNEGKIDLGDGGDDGGDGGDGGDAGLKCYRCAYTEPYLPEIETVVGAAGISYNKECGGEKPLGSNLVTNPAVIPSERTPKHLPIKTSSFMSKLVLSAMAKVPSAKVILSQLNGQKNNTVVNGPLVPSQAQMVEHCMKFMVKLDTAKLMEGEELQLPPGVEIPKEILMLDRDFYTDIQTVNQCFTMKELPAEMVAQIKEMGVLDIQLCLCNNKDGCNEGNLNMGDGGGGGGAGGGGASTISLGIFTTIFALFMYSTAF